MLKKCSLSHNHCLAKSRNTAAKLTLRCVIPSSQTDILIFNFIYIQGVSRLVDITAGGDFLGLCDQKSSYKHVSDFGRLRSYGNFLIPVHALV